MRLGLTHVHVVMHKVFVFIFNVSESKRDLLYVYTNHAQCHRCNGGERCVQHLCVCACVCICVRPPHISLSKHTVTFEEEEEDDTTSRLKLTESLRRSQKE